MAQTPTHTGLGSGKLKEVTLTGLDNVQHALESGRFVLSTTYGEQQFGIPSTERVPHAEPLGDGTFRSIGRNGRRITWFEGETMAQCGDVWWTTVRGDTSLLEHWLDYDVAMIASNLRSVRHQLSNILYPSLEHTG